MRRALWLCPLFLMACDSDTDPSDVVEQLTLLRVAPEDFLGTLPCQEGGVQSYQARLVDVTEGMDAAFALPASHLASCNAETLFQHVGAGRRYIAQIAAFEEDGLRPQNSGSTVVVDSTGQRVEPKWSTICYGDDRVDYSQLGGGGAGGAKPEAEALGVEAYFKTTTTIRGCTPFASDSASTTLTFDAAALLVGLSCGVEAGQVDSFSVSGEFAGPPGPEPAVGGNGGAGGAPGAEANGRTPCGDPLEVSGLSAGKELTFSLSAYEADSETPAYTTTCIGKPVQGVSTAATCDPILKR